jgi:YVTN family beta-propeller protein
MSPRHLWTLAPQGPRLVLSELLLTAWLVMPAVPTRVASLHVVVGQGQPARLRMLGSPSTAPPVIIATINTQQWNRDRATFGAGALWEPNPDSGTVTWIDPLTYRAAIIKVGDAQRALANVDPQAVVVVRGMVWATDRADQALVRIDLRTRKVVAKVAIGTDAYDLVVADGSLWADSFDGGMVVRTDPRTRRVTARLQLDALTGMGAGGGAVWVALHHAAAVARIDPRTNKVVATVAVGIQPMAVAVGRDTVWVEMASDGSIQRIDPRTNKVVATIQTGTIPDVDLNLAVGYGSLWVASGPHLLRIDERTNRIVAALLIPGGSPQNVAVGAGSLWVGAAPDQVYRIDPRRIP